MMMLSQAHTRTRGWFAWRAAAAIVLGLATAPAVAAQSAGCPIATDSTVSQAVGSSVVGSVDATAGALTICSFSDGSGTTPTFGVSRETDAFAAGGGGAAALAQRYIPSLPAAAAEELGALNQAGMNVSVPDYDFESVSGIGDSALWVKTQLTPNSARDSLLVQSGTNGFSFDTDDGPDARATLTALAQAVLAQP